MFKFVVIRSSLSVVCKMFLLSRKKGVRSHVPSQGGNPAKQSDTVQPVHCVTAHHIILIKMSIICSRLVYLCSHENIWMIIESDFQ